MSSVKEAPLPQWKPLSERSKTWKILRPFTLGAIAACTSTICVQPIDMVKVRIQLQGEGSKVSVNRSPFKLAAQIIKNEGPLAFYKGLSAALFRQLTYGTIRLGLFRTLTDRFTPKGGKLTVPERIGCSLVAGGVGALIGTPGDAALVRMQADATLPPAERRGYKNVFDALYKMAKHDGIQKGLFAGGTPTVLRALAVNVGQLSTYDTAKEQLAQYTGNGKLNILSASAVSGICASTLSLPFDFLKTRLQKQKTLPDGSLPYRGLWDCALKVTKQEGPLAFYRGYGTYIVRLSPHIMISWAVLEFLESFKSLK